MRIELCVCGGPSTVSMCCDDLTSHIFNTDSILNGFTAIKKQTANLNGGIGRLQTAQDELDARIQKETERADQFRSTRDSFCRFLESSRRIDQQVAELTEQRSREFSAVCPRLRPAESIEEKTWLEKAMDFLIGEENVDAVQDTFSRCWQAAKEFYQEHKKEIVETVLLVVAAVGAIAAVIGTGGVALVPLLTVLGFSTATATTISTIIGVVAVVLTTASTGFNLADVWGDFEDPWFHTTKNVLNLFSGLFNGVYSIGNLYNSFKGVSGKEFIAREKAIENGKRGYRNLEAEHPRMEHKAYGEYDQSRKKAIYAENRRRNNGVLRSDKTGKILERPKKSLPGVEPSPYEAQIDHVFSRSRGGFNSFDNAQVIERGANIQKGDSLVFNDYMRYSRPDKANWWKFGAWSLQGADSFTTTKYFASEGN